MRKSPEALTELFLRSSTPYHLPGVPDLLQRGLSTQVSCIRYSVAEHGYIRLKRRKGVADECNNVQSGEASHRTSRRRGDEGSSQRTAHLTGVHKDEGRINNVED